MGVNKKMMLMMKEIYHFKDVPDWKDNVICIVLWSMFLLLFLFPVASLLIALRINIDKIPIILGIIILVIVIIIGIYQFWKLRK